MKTSLGRFARSSAFEMVGKGERSISTKEAAVAYQTRFREIFGDLPQLNLRVADDSEDDGSTGSGYSITLVSNDLDLLRERTQAAKALLEQNGTLRNVMSNLSRSNTERVFIINEARLAGTGLTPTSVFETLNIYSTGSEAAKLRDGGKEFPIIVKIDPALLSSEQALLSQPVYAPGLGALVPTGQFGSFKTQTSPAQIGRSDQSYAATLKAQLAPESPGLSQVRQEAKSLLTENGIFGADVKEGQAGGEDLLQDLISGAPIAFGLALLLNFMVLATQFNSFRIPLYILVTVPLALVGAFWLFYFTGNSLDVISMLGVVMLIGLVTKNAILLLEVILEGTQSGKVDSLKDLLIEAGTLRFRPILMTTLTVVIISVPLLLGFGEGSEFRLPLGLVILGGVMTSMLLTLYVVPAAFYLFERGRVENEQAHSDDERDLRRSGHMTPGTPVST